jgi:exosortase A-associated hydrolase 2
MNKSRALITQLAKAVASEGHAFVVADLYGTGDSEGNFEDASIDIWSKNLDAVADWISERGLQLRSIVAIRFGCLLAGYWIGGSDRRVHSSVFWQPATSGASIVNQWLRMRVAASVFDGTKKVTRSELVERLDVGDTLEIGGYLLTPSMSRQLNSLELRKLVGSAMGQIHVFEVGSGAECSPAIQQLAHERGDCRTRMVPGDPFWMATEIVQNPTLVRNTVDALFGSSP